MTFYSELAVPQDVIDRLNTEWDTITVEDAIAKPTFKEGFLGEIQNDGNTILVGWPEIDLNQLPKNKGNDKVNNLFEVSIIADHNVEATAKTNLKKMFSQVRRHINREIINGEWHVDVAIPDKNGHEQYLICSVRQSLDIIGA